MFAWCLSIPFVYPLLSAQARIPRGLFPLASCLCAYFFIRSSFGVKFIGMFNTPRRPWFSAACLAGRVCCFYFAAMFSAKLRGSLPVGLYHQIPIAEPPSRRGASRSFARGGHHFPLTQSKFVESPQLGLAGYGGRGSFSSVRSRVLRRILACLGSTCLGFFSGGCFG